MSEKKIISSGYLSSFLWRPHLLKHPAFLSNLHLFLFYISKIIDKVQGTVTTSDDIGQAIK